MTKMTEAERPLSHLNWVDGAKGVAIVLVVLGHEISGLADANLINRDGVWNFLYEWIYAFHVPLFFLVSGLFVLKSLRKPWTEFFDEKIRTLLYPYFLWSIITLVIKSFVGEDSNHPYTIMDILRILYNPIDQFWFLYVLFILYLLIAFVINSGGGRWTVLTIAVLLDPRLVPAPSLPSPPLVEARLFFIFMALGAVLGTKPVMGSLRRLEPWMLWLAIPCGYGAAAMVNLPLAPPFGFLVIVFALGGIGATAAVAILSERGLLGRVLQLLGRRSLEIYVAHTVAAAGARVFLVKILHVTAIAPHLVAGAAAGILTPLAMAAAFERVGFRWAFEAPKSRDRAARLPLASG